MSATAPAEPPYRGLEPFSEKAEDVSYFFGRKRETEMIADNLIAARLTVLHGESGVGKTSVLRAGVASRLLERAKRRPPRFVPVVFSSWDQDPIPLRDRVQQSIHKLTEQKVEQDKDGLVKLFAAWTKQLHAGLLIILDQFEEYFLYHEGEDGAGSFAAEFADVVNRPDLPVNVLIAIREDALGKLDWFNGRIPHLFDNRLELKHLERKAAWDAIVEPIHQFNRRFPDQAVEIEPKLVDAVLSAVRTGQISLTEEIGRGSVKERQDADGFRVEESYLQLVMRRLWLEEMQRGSRKLRARTLVELGGAEEIVRAHIGTIMADLPEQERRIGAGVFSYLVTPSGGKIATTASDLKEMAGLEPPVENIERVLRTLEDKRIVTARGSRPRRYEIFHDMLAQAVLSWRTKYFQDQRMKQAVAAQALYQLAHGQCEVAALLARQAYLLNREEGRRINNPIETVLRQVLSTSPFTYILYRNESFDFPSLTFSPDGTLMAAGDKGGHVHLWDLTKADTPSAVFPAHWANVEVLSVAFSPDGRQLASGGRDGTAKLLDVEAFRREYEAGTDSRGIYAAVRPTELFHSDGAGVSSVRFSPDGQILVSADWNGFLRFWDPGNGNLLNEWRGHEGWIWSAAFSPDGRWLASAGRDCVLRVWERHRPGFLLCRLEGHSEEVISIACSPDGTRLASGSRDRTVRLWNMPNGPEGEVNGHVLGHHEDTVRAVAFSPSGRLLASASEDETVRLWDATGSEADAGMGVLRHFYGVNCVAFKPQCERTVVSSCWDRTVRVWDVEAAEPRLLKGHRDNVMAVAFGRDGRVASASWDRTVRLWDLSQPEPQCRVFGDHGDKVYTVALYTSPDGQFQVLASGSLNGRVRLWDLRCPDPEQRGPCQEFQHSGPVSSLAIRADGQLIAAGGHDGKTRWWGLRESAGFFAEAVAGSPVTSVAFSPEGWLASGSDDGLVRLWRLEPPDGPVLLSTLRGHVGRVWTVAFRPRGGKLLAAGGDDRTIRLWDLEDPANPVCTATLGDHEFWVGSVAFNPQGTLLASGAYDWLVTLWDLSNIQAGPTVLRGHQQSVTSVAFSPDGKQLASGSYDDTVRIWTVDTDALADKVCSKVSRNLSLEEWERFVGTGVRYERTCSRFPPGKDAPPDS